MCIFKRKKKLEIGQIWKSHDDDPFITNYYCNEIIDLKDGWVQYYAFYKNNFDANEKYYKFSCKEDTFRWLCEDFLADNRESLEKIM